MNRPEDDLFEYAMRSRPAYPSAPGHKDRATSRDAARAVAGSTEAVRLEILAVLRRRPSTPDEVAAAIGRSVLYVRPRLSELAHPLDGRAVKTKTRRRNASGLSAAVYQAKESDA